MIIVKVMKDIHGHWPARKSEWILAAMMFGWGVILFKEGSVFDGNRAWSEMAQIMSETSWGILAMVVSAVRLIALTVNGTFSKSWYSRWSPHVRSLCSLLSCGVWMQIAFGLYMSDAATTGLSVYPGLLVLDLTNVLSGMKDAGEMDKAKKANGGRT